MAQTCHWMIFLHNQPVVDLACYLYFRCTKLLEPTFFIFGNCKIMYVNLSQKYIFYRYVFLCYVSPLALVKVCPQAVALFSNTHFCETSTRCIDVHGQQPSWHNAKSIVDADASRASHAKSLKSIPGSDRPRAAYSGDHIQR